MRNPELTARDKGEMYALKVPLRNLELAAVLKRVWAAGVKPKQAAVLSGFSREYVRQFYKCFARALRFPNAPLSEVGEGRKREKRGVKVGKGEKREGGAKKRKSLTVNFGVPVGGCHTRSKGVTRREGRGWQAQKRVGKTVKYLGLFRTAKEAEQAVKEFEMRFLE